MGGIRKPQKSIKMKTMQALAICTIDLVAANVEKIKSNSDIKTLKTNTIPKKLK